MKTNSYRRGQYPRGHGIRCKHCGHSYEEHQKPDNVRHPTVFRKGFGASFSRCQRYGYEPGNREKWERRDRAYEEKERRDFEMQCYERRAQGEAAWGRYGAMMRQQSQARDRANLEQEVSRARSESERRAAEGRLGQFLRSRQGGGMLVVGSGAGSSRIDDD